MQPKEPEELICTAEVTVILLAEAYHSLQFFPFEYPQYVIFSKEKMNRPC